MRPSQTGKLEVEVFFISVNVALNKTFGTDLVVDGCAFVDRELYSKFFVSGLVEVLNQLCFGGMDSR